VKFLFVYNSNALASSPNQEKIRAGLAREDLFTVVFDSVLTDTARYADVVLPAATFLERRELSRSYGVFALQEAYPASPPVGESRANDEVFAELVRCTGFARRRSRRGEALTRALLRGPRQAALLDGLRQSRIAYPEFGTQPIQFVDVFPATVDRRVHLFPAALDREAPAGLYGFQPDPASEAFPLALISPASDRMITSTLSNLDPLSAAVELCPEDAAARRIGYGDPVRLYNPLGEVRCHAKLNPRLRRGVALLEKGLWARHPRTAPPPMRSAPIP
jgi:anaerobic selenocysteine-containing dehydrogenase